MRRPLGRRELPVLVAFTALVGTALGVPVGSVVYWMFEGGAHPITGVSLAARRSTPASTAPRPRSSRRDGAAGRTPSRCESEEAASTARPNTFLVLAMPGLVVALALAYFSEQHANAFGYQTRADLIFAYAIMFFPLALVGVRASVAQAPAASKRSPFARRAAKPRAAARTLPLIAPGLGAAFCLVFLSAVTEFTATLI